MPAEPINPTDAEVAAASARERQRIAHDLHDGLGQLLAGLALKAQSLQETLTEKGLPEAEEAAALVRLANEATAHTRLLARGLDPVVPPTETFAAALAKLARDTSRLFRQVTCEFHGDLALTTASPHAAQHLFRVAQEAINNALRHGKATRIDLDLASDATALVLTISDNGSGLVQREKSSGIGIRIMNHRLNSIGGTFELAAGAAGGVTVTCRLPHTPR